MTENEDWYASDVATFGDRVAAARENADMTQAALAKRLGIKQSTLRGWEDDLSEPRANRLATLAGVLGVSMMWLINGEGDGIDAPDDAQTSDDNIKEALIELRDMRADLLKRAEQMGRLEKKLRRIFKGTTHG
ncbi:MAG: helix-turn-helix domain-containing protein [Sulfitobacter litoralis]|jgi:transcriptional regulator with XRE-family HTH domain|uniref:Helix-turn-helix domain-containing protein n=2 Tax=root TaxID=1 RepID=A0A1H0QXR4_9RHOB|nr:MULTISPECIES: helix-turn-helix domain-containing protein [Sulfitobacter]MBQ0717593.1 helix-turn-helix domain-containing protein [Sulfitobacter litoralis]MBQ0765500.1 helix-turn-helix domain-containing protein [Sulfitobacter litoralis]MBQ0800875.1 helix-turn-helix domain-containing protein [Sulfitobacter litoralis]MCF7726447.1 helix-turn-helix domain-containing protein [Sulfitobacter sp. M22]MCF7777789.1 helix-turn-helix domain-containing protein [Sulfitobacter sp. M220]|tara:strand:- start:737 stop:1135 length:399 start_codon:yes stop_codon:yes gene_type:complete